MVYPVKQEGNINMLMQKNKKDNGVLAFREIFCRRQQVFERKVNLSIQKRGSAGKLADRSIVKGTEQGSMCLLAVLKSATCL